MLQSSTALQMTMDTADGTAELSTHHLSCEGMRLSMAPAIGRGQAGDKIALRRDIRGHEGEVGAAFCSQLLRMAALYMVVQHGGGLLLEPAVGGRAGPPQGPCPCCVLLQRLPKCHDHAICAEEGSALVSCQGLSWDKPLCFLMTRPSAERLHNMTLATKLLSFRGVPS